MTSSYNYLMFVVGGKPAHKGYLFSNLGGVRQQYHSNVSSTAGAQAASQTLPGIS